MRIPTLLADNFSHEHEWLEQLPRLAADCAGRWGLELEQPIETPRALVIPAGPAVLKINAPGHTEADHEGEALARWDGSGAVRLLAHDEERRALLIERCFPGTRMWDATVDEPQVLLDLLPRLTIELGDAAPFQLLADEADRWADELPLRYRLGGAPFESELLDLALDVFRSVDRTASFLVNQDLHGGNILMAQREPWLVIDPKPLVGEPELNAVGLLRNAVAEGYDSATSVQLWLDSLQELGLSAERMRGWAVAHTLAWGWQEDGGWRDWSIGVARRILTG